MLSPVRCREIEEPDQNRYDGERRPKQSARKRNAKRRDVDFISRLEQEQSRQPPSRQGVNCCLKKLYHAARILKKRMPRVETGIQQLVESVVTDGDVCERRAHERQAAKQD